MANLEYQLVLQWPSEAFDGDYDRFIEIEELLLQTLPEKDVVDGHDWGSSEFNIFVLTNDPLQCFEKIRKTLEDHPSWAAVRIAFREIIGDGYTILWPKDLRQFNVV